MESPLLEASTRLKTAVSALEDHLGLSAIALTPLGGSGNRSVRVDFESTSAALRVNASTQHLGVNREREKVVLDLIKQEAISPEVFLWQEDYFATRYIEAIDPPSLTTIAKTLRKLHSLPVPQSFQTSPAWTPVDTIRDYLKAVETSLPQVEACLEQLQLADWKQLSYAVCHCDLNPENILYSDGSAFLIDWEYARYGPVAYDLAVLSETHKLGSAEVEALLHHYAGLVDHASLTLNRRAYRLIEALWAHLAAPSQQTILAIEAAALPDMKPNAGAAIHHTNNR